MTALTYEQFIAKHQLKLELTWKGFEVKPPIGDVSHSWPCFKWGYKITKASSNYGFEGDYHQGIAHGEFKPQLHEHSRGSLAYTQKLGLCFKLYSGGCYPIIQKGAIATKPYGEAAGRPNRPWFQFENPDGGRSGPKFYVNLPALAEILDCLCNDSECAYPTFEEFASCLGLSQDSRAAEQTYLACCETERKLRRLLGARGMIELLEEVER